VNFELAAALQNLNREEEASLHFKNAAELFRELTERYPQTPEFQFKLGAALVKILDLENAAKAFGKVIEMNPDEAAGYIELAKVFELQGKYDEGIEMLQQVIDRMQDKQPDDDVRALRAMLEVLQFKQWRESQEKDR
jgi:tetratricopeptide (TPR) repeat protein